MKIKDIEKEGFIKFEEKDKNKEIDQEEYNQLIETVYYNCLKFGKIKKIPKLLEEKFSNLKY